MKKTLLIGLTLICSASLSLAQPPPPSADATADNAITTLRENLIQSFFKGDVDRLVTYLAPDVVVTWQNGEVSHGPEEVRAYYNRMMTGEHRVVREIKAEPEILGRHVYGDWAVSWGNLHDRYRLNDGRDLPFNSLFTIVTAKRGDRWLVTSYHASINAFENPVLAATVKKVGLWAGLGGIFLGVVAGWILKSFRGRAVTV